MSKARSIPELAFDRDKVLCWWTGRITNADLAEWSGQSERDVRLILDTPFMRGEIIGGGRGSKHKRRISRKARNAVAIVAALRKAGMTIEAAAALMDAVPVLASFPTEVVDFSPSTLEAVPANYGNPVMLMKQLPDSGWLPSDVVPRHVFNRHCRPIVKANADEQVGLGDIGWLPDWKEEALGGLPDGWRGFGEPIYRPEIDPLGIYEYGHDQPDASDALDDHFYIVDGRWVFCRHHDPSPREYMSDVFQWAELGAKRRYAPDALSFTYEPIAEITPSERWANSLRGDVERERQAERAWREPETKLDVNATLAVRRMKRTAMGLTGGSNG